MVAEGRPRNDYREAPPEKRPAEGEVGTSLSAADSLFTYYDPLRKRRKPKPVELQNMRSMDGWAEAIFIALTRPIQATDWSIEPDEADNGEAELCKEMLAPLLPRIVALECGAVGDGIAYAELVWEERDGQLWLIDVAKRPVDQCEPIRDRHGHILGFRQITWTEWGVLDEEFLISERKAFVFLHDEVSNPNVGKSALETAFHYYSDKRILGFYRNKNLERFGGPSVIGKTNKAGDKRTEFHNAVKELRAVGTAVIDLGNGPASEEKVDLLHAPNAGVAFKQAKTEDNFEMAVSAQVQWLAMAQEGNSGSYNSSDVHNQLLTSVREGRISEMEDANGALCQAICDLNVGINAAVPTIKAESTDDAPKQLVNAAAEQEFGSGGRKTPAWYANQLLLKRARQMGIEKPEGAPDPFTDEPELEPSPERQDDQQDGDPNADREDQ